MPYSAMLACYAYAWFAGRLRRALLAMAALPFHASRGLSAYAPLMMVRILLYGYATGVYSSRKIQAKTYDDVAFCFLSADEHPDHSTLAELRKRHLQALAGLFRQALQLCAKAGLVKLGHVSIDGTKIKANASRGPRGQVFVRGVAASTRP
jgi:transposase